MVPKEREIQDLQNRVVELERQLAEAQTVIMDLTLLKEDSANTNRGQRDDQRQLREIDQENPLASDEDLREAVLLAPYPLMIQRDDGQVVMINHAWTEITGYTLRDIPTIGEWMRKAYGKREIQTNSLLLSKGYFHDGLKKSGEVKVITRVGEKRIWDISTAPLGVDRKGRRLMVVMGVDVTERKRAEESLRESQRQLQQTARALELDRARLAAILEHLPVGIWIADGQGRLIGKNEQADRIWAGEAPLLKSTEEYRQYVAWDPESGKLLQPEEYPVAKALQTGQRVEPVELNIRRFDGTKGTVLVSAVPFKDDQDLLTGVVGVNVDITERKRTEEALRLSEARYRSLVETAFEGVWVVDTSGRTTFVNRRMAEMLKYDSPTDLMDHSAFDFVPQEDREEIQAKFKARLKKNGPEQYDVRLLCRDGSVIWASAAAHNLVDESGNITGRMALFMDITGRKQAEEALRRSEERFNKAFHASPNALVISRIEDGRIETVNGTFVKLFGYREEEVIGKTSDELGMFVNSQDRQEAVFKLLRDTFVRDFEMDVRLKSGEVRNVSLSIEVISIGGQNTMLTTIQDISRRKRAEKALRESEERYRSLFEMMQEGLVAAEVITDEKGNPIDYRYLDVNPATERQFGIPREQFIGRTFTEVLPDADSEWIEILGRVALTGEPLTVERYGKVTGLWFECHIYSPRRGEFVNILTDITERKQAEEALQASEAKMRAVFQSLTEGVVFLNPSGRVEEANHAVQRSFGHSIQELTDQQLDPRSRIIRPDGTLFPEEEQPAILALRTGQAVRNVEMGVPTQDGKISWRLVNAQPVYNDRGDLLGAVASFFDITERRQLENALRKRESILAQAGEMAHLGAWDIEYDNPDDLNDNPLTWSDEVYRIFGYAPGEVEVSNELFFERVHPEDRTRIQEGVAQAIATRQPYSIEHRIIRPDGEERVVQEHAEVFFDDSGNLARIIGAVQDITERKRAEEALREAEVKYRTLVEHIPNAVTYIDSLDSRVGTFYVSPQIETMLGCTVKEWQDNPRSWQDSIHPEDRDRMLESDAHHESTGEPFSLEYRMLARNGETVWVRDEAIMIRDSTGQPQFSQGIMIDITERKRAEERLRESEERFRSLADSMPQLVWTALPDGRVDYYNQRYKEYQEIKQVETDTWEWGPVLHPDDLPATAKAWQRSVETGEIYEIEHRVRMTNGSYRWHLSRGVPMRDEKGKIIRWFGTATDIHDLKQAEEQLKVYANRLKRSNQELEQFAFMASHDLQEPLRKIEMFGDLLLERATSFNDRERNYLERMQNASGRMRGMVEGLLQLSRVATQGKPFVPVNLSQVTSEVLDDLENLIQRLAGKVEVKTLPVVQGDPLQLRQLMQNLIGNALKYHRPDEPPEVKIFAKKLTGKVQIHVADQGIGFHQEDAERVFQPFQRLVGRSEYEGSGIGLAICRRIVERHNGEIVAMSSPGQGATFIITLPIHFPESPLNNHRKDANNESPGATSYR